VENVLKLSACSRSLDNITVLILGLKNFKKIIQKLLDGHTLSQIREHNVIQNKGKKNFAEEQEFFEVNEEEINI